MDHIVFVYGTLRRGEHNSYLFGDSKCLGPAVTAGTSYKMSRSGTVPFVSDGGNARVQGELWSVDDKTFRRLDRLESHPRFYRRIERWFRMTNKRGQPIRGWIYLCNMTAQPVLPNEEGLLRCPTRLELNASGFL